MSAVNPGSVTAGAAAQTLTVTGSGFITSSSVTFNGIAISTTYVSATSLQAQIPASALAAGATVSLTVSNPAPGGGSSAATSFAVMSPTPAINSITPTYIPQGTAATLTVSGTGFEANSVVKWNGSARPTTFFSINTLTVALTAADVSAAGNGQVVVSNPGPGGSDTQPTAEVVYATPAVTGIAPASVQAGGTATSITVTGTNFSTNSVVLLDNVALATTYVSATSLTAQVPTSALANARNAAVTVQNPTPVPSVSAAAPLPVNSPTPVLNFVSPGLAIQGATSATLSLTGTGFIANSSVSWNGNPIPTTYVSPTLVRATLSAANLATAGPGQLTVSNPAPNAGTSAALSLPVVAPPTISAVSPSFIQIPAPGAAATTTNVTITGTNFTAASRVWLNGSNLTVVSQTGTQIVASVNSQNLFQTGALPVTVLSPVPNVNNTFVSSQPGTINIINPLGTLYVYPNSAQVGSPNTTITISGSGFFADSVVEWNGVPLVTTYSSSSSLTAVIPAADLTVAGGGTLNVLSPENMGLPTSTAAFSTYLALPINGLVYNPTDGLLYATIAGSGGPGLGNSLVGIDPITGAIQRKIFVGSEPTRLALSTDGTQAFVGLNGAGAVRQVDLVGGVPGVQFSLGGSQGIYNPPFTAAGLAALPGQPNSVAVYGNNGVITIFDSGVARPKSSSGLANYFSSNSGALAFGPSASTLYLAASAAGSYVYQLTIDNTGVTGYKQLTSNAAGATIQYDNGRLYTPNGLVSDPATGATLGQFSTTTSYSTTPVAANGPIYSDSALNRAWIVVNNFGADTVQLASYDETTFLPITTQNINGIGAVAGSNNYGSSNPADLVRWGQDGLAFHTQSQLYLLHGSIVKDTSSTPADLQVTTQLAATVTTGTPFTFQIQVKNLGTSTANGVVLGTSLPATLLYGSVTASQGSCTGAGILYCNLGNVANGATAIVSITATPSVAGAAQISATVDSQTFDPSISNNTVVSTTTASGSLYAPVPTASSISPNGIATGSTSTTLTVNGAGFNSASVINWNGTALPTSLVSAAQLQATIDPSLVKQIGSATITVSNPSPGGGTSGPLTVSIYSLLPLPANAMVYDPYTRKLVAVLPSSSTTPVGNSVVYVDPATGTVGTPVPVGSEPNTIVESPGGKYFYVGISGSKSLARFNAASQTIDATIPLVNSGFFGGPTAANALAAIPGLPDSVSVDNVGIYDFAGTTATLRPNSALGYNDAVFPDASHAYTYDNQSTGAELYRYTVDAAGVHIIDGSTMLGMGGFSGTLALDQGLLFGAGGGIIDPTTATPTQIGVLPLGPGPYGYGLSGAGALPYQETKKNFLFGINSAGTWAVVLNRFDTVHFILEDSVQLPTNNQIIQSVPATRWGQDGIALLLGGGLGSSSPSQLMLMRGAFVLPAETVANIAPTLSAVGTGTLAAGSGNQLVAVTGSGFIAGASMLWNGVAYSTTFVDSQHLTMAVGANDVAKAGTISITCQNPGSSPSNAIALPIQ